MDGATAGMAVRQGRRPVATLRPLGGPDHHADEGRLSDPAALRLDLLEQALHRSAVLLAAVPDGADSQAGPPWLAEADAVLDIPVDFDRTGLLRARAQVARGTPGVASSRVSTTAPSSAAAATLSHAVGYIDAAVGALRVDEVSEALELAVRGLVAFDTIPQVQQDRVAEGRMASALGDLCCAFFDHERALRFYEIAAEALSPATERAAWTAASRRVADLALIRMREIADDQHPRRADLLARAEQIGHRLSAIGEPRHVVAVYGRRIVADVRCEQGAPAAAWQLLELTDRAIIMSARCERRSAADREIAVVRLTRGRCLHQLGRSTDALAELDAALAGLDPDLDLVHHMEGLRLRSLAREDAGDTHGALVDSRRLADRVWARHQRQIGGFMDQVWGRAGAESRRRALEMREQQLIRTAEQDPLTGLANRRGVERFCATMPPGSHVCLVLIDIDHFKAVNDRYGHAAGDAVLREVGAVLTGSVRDVDRVARWGGEEFLIALPTPSAELGAEAATRVLSRVAEHDWSSVLGTVRLTVSAGVASGPAGDLRGVLDQADAALYSAKRAGRNRVVAA